MGYAFWVSLFSIAKQFGPLYLYSKDKSPNCTNMLNKVIQIIRNKQLFGDECTNHPTSHDVAKVDWYRRHRDILFYLRTVYFLLVPLPLTGVEAI